MALTAAATNSIPYAMPCFAESNCSYPGIDVEFLKTVMALANQRLNLISLPSNDDVFQAINNETVDITATTFPVQYDNSDKFSVINVPGMLFSLIFITKKLNYFDASSFIILKLISPETWMIMLAFCACFYLNVTAFILKRRKANAPVNYYHERLIGLVGVLWFFLFSLILNCYANLLTLYVAVPKQIVTSEVKNVEDIINKLHDGSCVLVATDPFCRNSTFSITMNVT